TDCRTLRQPGPFRQLQNGISRHRDVLANLHTTVQPEGMAVERRLCPKVRATRKRSDASCAGADRVRSIQCPPDHTSRPVRKPRVSVEQGSTLRRNHLFPLQVLRSVVKTSPLRCNRDGDAIRQRRRTPPLPEWEGKET